MTDHYYTENPLSAHDEWQVAVEALGNRMTFTTDAGVFSRDGLDRGTQVLLNALPELSGRVLDLGCGWGAVGVSLGRRYPALEIVMTDINSRAVALARRFDGEIVSVVNEADSVRMRDAATNMASNIVEEVKDAIDQDKHD